MILRVEIVDLQQIVIDILHADLGLHTIHVHGLEREHRKRAGPSCVSVWSMRKAIGSPGETPRTRWAFISFCATFRGI